MCDRKNNCLRPFARAVIRRCARRLVRCLGGAAEDFEDYRQELTLRLLQSQSRFNPDTAHENQWTATIVERAFARLLRERGAQKRNPGAILSLASRTSDDGPIDPPDYRGSDHDLERSNLRADVEEVLGRQPAQHRQLAERLKVQTVSQAALDLGMPRGTVQRQVERLRKCFTDAGLQDYL